MLLKLYSLSDRYCNYLRNFDNKIYQNKETDRKHSRKYLGIVLNINNLNYYIPLSSPKKSDYNDKKCSKIRKSTNTIIRIKSKDRTGNEILRGTLRISNMIPIPMYEVEEYNKSNELDKKYLDVINDELKFISKNEKKIVKLAKLVYKQKIENRKISYLDSCVDYKLLEKKCKEYMNNLDIHA